MRYKKKQRPKRKEIIYNGITMASVSEVEFAKNLDAKRYTWMYEPESFDWYIIYKYIIEKEVTSGDKKVEPNVNKFINKFFKEDKKSNEIELFKEMEEVKSVFPRFH